MPSAIIGLASRLPGARDLNEFWQVLIDGRCTVQDTPVGRWSVERFLHPNAAALGYSYSFAGGFLDDPLAFDPLAFGISPREAAQIDPQQRLLLELVWEALEDAGIPPSRVAGEKIGVYVGASNVDYQGAASIDQAVMESHFITGISLAIASNRISYTFDWKGPSMTVDTACSSSIVALDKAMQAIDAGIIDTAVVAGVNMLLSPIPFIGFSRARMLSPTGRSRPFSAKADGYVRSEGGAALVLRRLDIARRSGDPIRSVVVATGVNSDGRTVGVSLPSVDGQASLLKEVYARSGVPPDRLAFVEAHGTGTPVGDPIEARAIGQALGIGRREPLTIGSVKSNIGHLESASGAAALTKVVLSLQKGIYPRTLHLDEPSPHVPFAELNLRPAAHDLVLSVPKGDVAMAGICNYGFGGTNAHAILRAPTAEERSGVSASAASRAEVLVLSAHTREALSAVASAYHAALSDEASEFDLVARASARQRDLLAHRLVMPLSTRDEALAALARIAAGDEETKVTIAVAAPATRLALVFPGNGCQWPGMGVAAYRSNADFARELQAVDRIFQLLAGWSLIEALHADDIKERLASTSVAQPLVFAIQSALFAVLKLYGLQADFVLGHSVGEVAAAEASGALSREAAVRLVIERSQHQESVRGLGGMMAISADEATARDLVEAVSRDLEIAAVNSPGSVTVSGDELALKALAVEARRRRIATLKLDLDYPFHSGLLEPVREGLLEGLSRISLHETSIPFISSVTGGPVEGGQLDVAYWWRNVRQKVLFKDATAFAAENGATLFLEISPRPILLGAVADTCRSVGSDAAAVGSLNEKDGQGERDPVLAVVSTLLARGALPLGDKLIGSNPGIRVPLPHYPWQRQLCVLPKTKEGIEAFGRIDGGKHHPLIGTRLVDDSPEWRMLLDAELVPYLADHRVGGEIVVPGAALVEMALAVGRDVYGDLPLELNDVDIFRPMIIPEGGMREISVRFERSLSRVEVWSRPRFADDWAFNAAGRVAPAQGESDHPANGLDQANITTHTRQDVYRASERAGLQYGPSFQRVRALRRGGSWLDAELSIEPPPLGQFQDRHLIDPSALDAAFHGLFAGLTQKAGETKAFLPVRIQRLTCWQPGVRIARALVEVVKETPRSQTLRGWLLDAAGGVVCDFEGVYLRAAILGRTDHESRIFHTRFEPLQAINPTALPTLPLAREQIDTEAPQAWLLARAAVISAAHDVLLKIANSRPFELGAAIEHGLVHPDSAALLGVALCSLEAAELATEQDGIWTICAESPFPPPALLVATLAERFPEAQAELLCTNSVATRLFDRLRLGKGELSDDVTALFWQSASFLSQTVDAIEEHVRAIIAASAPRRPRVALIEPSAHALHERLEAMAERGEILLLTAGDGAARMRRRAELGSHFDLSSEDRDATGTLATIDAIVGLPNGRLPSVASLERLLPLLAPSVSALLAALPQDDALNLVLGLGEGWLEGQSDPWLTGSVVTSAEEITVALKQLGFVIQSELTSATGSILFEALRRTPPCVAVEVRPQLIISGSARDGSSLVAALASLSGEGSPVWIDLPADEREGVELQARALRITERLQVFERNNEQGPLWIITRDAFGLGGVADPASDAIWSFGRVAVNEFPEIDIRLVSIASSLPSEIAAEHLLTAIARAGKERELLITDQGFLAPRIGGVSANRHAGSSGQRRLLKAEPGAGFEKFEWEWSNRREPAEGEIEVEVEAVGLNFRDVMVGMGLLDENLLAGGMSAGVLGFECAGRVTRLGPCVKELAVGDRVMGFAAEAFASHVTSRAESFCKVPGSLSLEAAATIPVAFATAWFALMEVARLRAGEVVLIHGAVGGVGLAAMQIARLVGARVIATAGSEERRQLALTLGAEAAYDSRSLEFAEQIRANHGGIDVALNSLAGEAMRATLRMLRPFGRFIELGKRDYLENTAIELRPFVRNLSYFGVDLDELLAHDPALVRRMLGDLADRFEDGVLRALPYRAFDGEHVSDAMRLMQRSGHVGKIVVRPAMRARDPDVMQSFVPRPGPFIVLGGTGGFGLETAFWLADQGATRVVVASRRGILDPAAGERWAAYADRISVEQADATDASSVGALVARVRERFGPISGIVHTAMVLEDGLLEGLTPEALNAVVAPKVNGVIALDDETRDDPLQCFVVYSSATTLIGNPGQGAYVLANAFMEGIMRQRRARGLPALAVGWGAIADAGVIARDRQLGERLARTTGVTGVSVKDALSHLGRLLAQGDSVEPVQIYSAMGRSSVANSLAVLATPAFAAMRQSNDGVEQGETLDLRAIIAGKDAVEALDIVLGVTKAEIGRILRIDAANIDARRPLAEIGMDSLMALELRLGVEKRIGIELPLMSLGDRTAVHVAEKILAGILGDSEETGEMVRLAGEMAAAHGADGPNLTEITAVAEVMELPARAKDGVL